MLLVFLLGLCAGSFVNAWVWRVHEGLPICRSRSICPNCKKQLAWYDNVPVVSFFLLRGKCRHCRRAISWQYPVVELTLSTLFLLSAASASPFEQVVRDCLVFIFLAAIFLFDFRWMEIPDRFTLIPAAVLLAASLWFGWLSSWSLFLGIIAGSGFFLLQYLISRGKWIGGGDIRLGAFMGVILGWPNILVGLLVAYMLGALVSLILLALKKKHLADTTPFGTYLTVGTVVAMVWGERILTWYVSFLS